MKILLLTYADDNLRAVGDLSAENKRAYAEKHGYDFYYGKEKLDERRPAWSKILYLEKLLPQYDWVFWSDADSLITNPEIKLEELIRNSDKDFIFCVDPLRGKGAINSGEFFVKNTDWSLRALRTVYENDKNWPYVEQDALIYIFTANPGHVDYRPLTEFNSYSLLNWQPGHFIAHFCLPNGRVKTKAWLLQEIQKLNKNADPFESA